MTDAAETIESHVSEDATAAAAPLDPGAAAQALPIEGVDADGRPWRRVFLETPLDRHGTKIHSVVVKKPLGNDCSGTSLTALNAADVISLGIVLPRVTSPVVSKQEVFKMGIDDLGEFAGTIIDFLLSTRRKAELGLTA